MDRDLGKWPDGLQPEEYQALTKEFNPTGFSADTWIDELVRAGMHYLVITAKHHDGFALWPSKASKFNVHDATPFRRDILGELKAACDRRGVRLGFYYSHWLDWEHPGGGRPFFKNAWGKQPTQEQFETYWQQKCLPQVAELSDAYRPALFWFDTWDKSSSDLINERRMDELINLVKSKNSDCLINSRIGIWAHSKGEHVVDFLSMGDNSISARHLEMPWESSGTLNKSWGYHQLDYDWKPSAGLVVNLISTSANGGNYQLNVGPMGNGVFPPAAVRRLREIGGWMAANGEAIYGTNYAGLPEQPWGKVTSRSSGEDGRLYLHVLKPPAGSITVTGLTRPPKSARVLETSQPLTWTQSADKPDFVVMLPNRATADTMPYVIALEY